MRRAGTFSDRLDCGHRGTLPRRWLAALLALAAVWATGVSGALATAAWTEIAKATFDGVCDGPGDGRSFSAAIGSFTSSTSSGKSLRDVAPASGIAKERIVLSDAATFAGTTLGLRLGTSRPATNGAWVSVVVEPLSDGGKFSLGVTESAEPDFCLPGSAGDGVTVDSFALDSDDGVLSVGGSNGGIKLKTTLKKGTRYRIEMSFREVGVTGDSVELWITNLATNEVEYLAQALPLGYQPVQALTVRKHAGKSGEWALDDFVVLAPPQ